MLLPPWRIDAARSALHPLVQGVVLPFGGPANWAEGLAVVVRRYGPHAAPHRPYYAVPLNYGYGVGYCGADGASWTAMNPAIYGRYWSSLGVEVPVPDSTGIELIWRHHPGYVPQLEGCPRGWFGLRAPLTMDLVFDAGATLYPELLGDWGRDDG